MAHARTVAGATVAAADAPGWAPTDDADRLAQTCFALRSALGTSGRLAQEDEAKLWELSRRLWEASMARRGASASDANTAASDALFAMAKELFSLVEDDSDGSRDAAAYVAFFSQAGAQGLEGREWVGAGGRH